MKESQVVTMFGFTDGPKSYTIRLFDDFTWEVVDVETTLPVQQGYWQKYGEG